MKDTKKTTEIDSARRRRVQRATRALVAGYIHELSDRHGGPRRGTFAAPARRAAPGGG